MSLLRFIENPGAEIPKKLGKTRRKMRYSFCKLINRIEGDFSDAVINLSWENKPNRFDLVSLVISQLRYQKYLEIGCDLNQLFDRVNVPFKVGVDPFSGGTLRMTSDAFFAQNHNTFDCVFIDGLHLYEQVKKDIDNSLKFLNDGGTIIVHDCLPLTHRLQTSRRESGSWNGDVWKALVEMRTRPDIDTAVCTIDQGIGIIKKRKNSNLLQLKTSDFKQLKYQDFAAHYPQWLNTIDYDGVSAFITNRT